MGKTRRNVANISTVRKLRVVSHQRISGKAIADLAAAFESEADGEITFKQPTTAVPGSRLLQQYHRHSLKFPTSWDDLPVAGLDESEVRIPASVTLWYVGAKEPTTVAVATLKETLEGLRNQMVSSVELHIGEIVAVVSLQTDEIEVEKVTPDLIGTRTLTRKLGLYEQYRYRRPDPEKLVREIISEIAYKPSRIPVVQVVLESGKVVFPHGNDYRADEPIVGAMMRVSVSGLSAFRGEWISAVIDNVGTKVRLFVNDGKTVTLGRAALLAVGFGVNARQDLGHPITWQFWYKAHHECYGVHYSDTQKLIVAEPVVS